MNQASNVIIMVQPSTFGYNTESAIDNSFQSLPTHLRDAEVVQKMALEEFKAMVALLKKVGVSVLVIKDTLLEKTTDSIFPNNWFSTHENGNLLLYPMKNPIRQLERKIGVIEFLEKNYQVKKKVDYTAFEKSNQFLEGTGSMILDRQNKIVYACISKRTHPDLLNIWASSNGYQSITFTSKNSDGIPIYHTNVIMAITTHFMIICLESIEKEVEKQALLNAAAKTDKIVVDIRLDQVAHFCGNVLEIIANKGLSIAMSTNAFDHFDEHQKEILLSKNKIIHLPIPTIETIGGGGVRCMIAEVFLNPK